MIDFSFIIPHKNIPKLLSRCISSIPKRDDLEIIIVDDNSDSNIVDFDNFPGNEREDVKLVFEKKNIGGGGARNTGIKHATGKWILFIDADDFFNSELSIFLDDNKDSMDDIIFFDTNSVDTDTLNVSNRGENLNSFIRTYFKNKNIGEIFLKYKFGEPWGKMIKRSLILNHNILFDEISIHNDLKFSYLVGFYAQTINVERRKIYCITSRKGSVSRLISDEKLLTRIKVFGEANMFFKNNGIKFEHKFLYSQLTKLYVEQRALFNKGLNILNELGYESKKIYLEIYKRLPARIIINLFKKIKNKI